MFVSKTTSRGDLRRIMVVDDHAIVRRGVRALIEGVPRWEVCAEASNGSEAMRLAAETRPDIVVMDLSMPGLSGIDATVEIRKILPQCEVLILTMHESDRMAGLALRAGARGYLIKNETENKLIEALEALSCRQPYFSPSVSETLLQGYRHSDPTHDLEQLTPRERQVVKLIAEDKSNKAIASMLNLSVKTVESYRSTAMQKIGVRSTVALTLYAVRNDIVQL